MRPIRTLEDLVADVKNAPPRRLAVAAGHDENTIRAAARAASEGLAKVILVGERARIEALCKESSLDPGFFDVINEPDEATAGTKARDMVRDGDAHVLMKGLIGTEAFMRLILDKEKGLLPRGALLTHLTVLDIPAYQRLHGKLLFVSDVAIIPAPDLPTMVRMVEYCVTAARSLGIERPKVALIAASEKVSDKMPATIEAAAIAKMAERGQIKEAIVDGPLALDVALSPAACEIKGLRSPIEGDADVLVFPDIEAGNVFYKAATILAGARLAAVVMGATAPCVLTSRADSEETKYYSIALGCRLARSRV
jgi:phosphate butyryltransferase